MRWGDADECSLTEINSEKWLKLYGGYNARNDEIRDNGLDGKGPYDDLTSSTCCRLRHVRLG